MKRYSLISIQKKISLSVLLRWNSKFGLNNEISVIDSLYDFVFHSVSKRRDNEHDFFHNLCNDRKMTL